MQNLEFYKSRTADALEEGLVEHKKGEKNKEELLHQLIRGEGKYKQLTAALSLVKEIMPEAITKPLAKKLNRRDLTNLPFNPEKLECKGKIGAGYVSRIYLLESKEDGQPSFVVKAGFFSGDVDKLQKQARQNHEDYKTISRRYSELPDLVPEEMNFLSTDRKDGKPAVATVQKFFGHNLRCVFSDFKRAELVKLLKDNSALRQDFNKFTEITMDWARKKDKVIDLLGRQNLSIGEMRGRLKLLFLDPHLISSTSSDDKKQNEGLEKALAYLESVKNEVRQ